MFAVKEKDADIKLRIREVIEARGGNASQLARDMDISAPYFGSILNSQDKGVSATLLKAIAGIGININWLLSGIGNMNSDEELGTELDSWKSKAVKNEITILSLEKKLEKLAFLVEHLDALLLSSHEKKTNHENNNQKENANSIK